MAILHENTPVSLDIHIILGYIPVSVHVGTYTLECTGLISYWPKEERFKFELDDLSVHYAIAHDPLLLMKLCRYWSITMASFRVSGPVGLFLSFYLYL